MLDSINYKKSKVNLLHYTWHWSSMVREASSYTLLWGPPSSAKSLKYATVR